MKDFGQIKNVIICLIIININLNTNLYIITILYKQFIFY